MLFFNNQLTQADENVCMHLITCRINSIKKMNHFHLWQYTTLKNEKQQKNTIEANKLHICFFV